MKPIGPLAIALRRFGTRRVGLAVLILRLVIGLLT